MKSYHISYHFRPTGRKPDPCQLWAAIVIDGEPLTYWVGWRKGKGFRPLGDIPNELAVKCAVKRLTDWWCEWDQATLRPVTIEHKNHHYGDDMYSPIRHTVIRWNRFTWTSSSSRIYIDTLPGAPAANCHLQTEVAWVPADATVEIEDLKESDGDEEMDQALKEVGVGGR
jgi:hypothetical protein